MERRLVEVRNRRGLHARAAAKMVALCERFDADVSVSYDGQVVPGISIMGLMMLGASIGAVLEVSATGPDAEAALIAVAALVDSGFHEQE